jgi:hypothetical protein
MQMNKINTSLAVTVLLSQLTFVTAYAQETYITRTTTTSTSTSVGEPTTVVTTTDAPVAVVPGSVVYLRTAPPTVLVTTIEGRRKDLEKTIDQAHQRGEISAAQCEAMKLELRRIAQETGSNTISYPAAVMLAQDLDLIGQQYRTVVATSPTYVPIITGSRFTVSTGQTYELDDLSVRRANLEARVTKALLKGRLSSGRAAELRIKLASIGNEANLYLADGRMDPKESRRLYDAFDRVASQLERYAGKDTDPS